jgi:hypothetical protein
MVDQTLRLAPIAIGDAGDEPSRAFQPAGHVLAEVGVIPHPRQRSGMQHLQQQGGDAADHHAGEVAMHLPDRAVRPEQARVLPIALHRVVARAANQQAHLGHDGFTDGRSSGMGGMDDRHRC